MCADSRNPSSQREAVIGFKSSASAVLAPVRVLLSSRYPQKVQNKVHPDTRVVSVLERSNQMSRAKWRTPEFVLWNPEPRLSNRFRTWWSIAFVHIDTNGHLPKLKVQVFLIRFSRDMDALLRRIRLRRPKFKPELNDEAVFCRSRPMSSFVPCSFAYGAGHTGQPLRYNDCSGGHAVLGEHA